VVRCCKSHELAEVARGVELMHERAAVGLAAGGESNGARWNKETQTWSRPRRRRRAAAPPPSTYTGRRGERSCCSQQQPWIELGEQVWLAGARSRSSLFGSCSCCGHELASLVQDWEWRTRSGSQLAEHSSSRARVDGFGTSTGVGQSLQGLPLQEIKLLSSLVHHGACARPVLGGSTAGCF
jgi:hypothetical protein